MTTKTITLLEDILVAGQAVPAGNTIDLPDDDAIYLCTVGRAQLAVAAPVQADTPASKKGA